MLAPSTTRPSLPRWSGLALLLVLVLGGGTAAALTRGSDEPTAAQAEGRCQEHVAAGLDALTTATFDGTTSVQDRRHWTVQGVVHVPDRADAPHGLSFTCDLWHRPATQTWGTTASWTPVLP